MRNIHTDVLVIGAGPAGSLAAAKVNQLGFDVLVVEKQKFPRFVIGESLLPRVMDHLEDTDLLDVVKKSKFQEKYGAKFVKDGKVCEFDFKNTFSEGWTWTWQVTRADFDKLLTDEIKKRGVKLLFEHSVVKINFEGTESTSIMVDKSGNEISIQAKFIIDASGYGRIIPKLFDLGIPSDFVPRETIFTHFTDPMRPSGDDGHRITVHVHKQDVWVWIIPFSNGATSVGIVGDDTFFKKHSTNQTEKMIAILEEIDTLRDRFTAENIVFEPKEIKGYAVGVKQLHGDGYALVGNATEFLDPIFSSGVTFAAESGVLAGKLASKQLNGEKVDWDLEYTSHLRHGIDVFRSYVESWYNGDLQELFFSSEQNQEFKKQICSILAGYVWDMENPFVRKYKTIIGTLAHIIKMKNNEAT